MTTISMLFGRILPKRYMAVKVSMNSRARTNMANIVSSIVMNLRALRFASCPCVPQTCSSDRSSHAFFLFHMHVPNVDDLHPCADRTSSETKSGHLDLRLDVCSTSSSSNRTRCAIYSIHWILRIAKLVLEHEPLPRHLLEREEIKGQSCLLLW